MTVPRQRLGATLFRRVANAWYQIERVPPPTRTPTYLSNQLKEFQPSNGYRRIDAIETRMTDDETFCVTKSLVLQVLDGYLLGVRKSLEWA